jgi:hypothetical protein
MTEPVPPPEEAPQQQPDPQDEDASSLVPALLIAYAAYLALRGAHHSLPSRDWVEVSNRLALRAIVGGQLIRISLRALVRQSDEAGRSGDELLKYSTQAVQAGVDAGIRILAKALIWTDVVSEGDPITKDVAEPGDRATIPTTDHPPELLADMVARATTAAAQFRAAELAGWRGVTWISKRDDRVRPTHRVLDGQSVPLGTPFLSPSGAKLRFPHDPRAPMAERVNCRCKLKAARR